MLVLIQVFFFSFIYRGIYEDSAVVVDKNLVQLIVNASSFISCTVDVNLRHILFSFHTITDHI